VIWGSRQLIGSVVLVQIKSLHLTFQAEGDTRHVLYKVWEGILNHKTGVGVMEIWFSDMVPNVENEGFLHGKTVPCIRRFLRRK
jgi:hypothetical protein